MEALAYVIPFAIFFLFWIALFRYLHGAGPRGSAAWQKRWLRLAVGAFAVSIVLLSSPLSNATSCSLLSAP